LIEVRAVTDTSATVPPSKQPASPACRNCGAAAPGAYCPNCGQETSLALPRVRELLREAAGRYVALDGRMWRTLIGLFFRPGFLSNEYFAGRRRRYIRPARLFLVLSIALFALLRFIGDPAALVRGDEAIHGDPEVIAREAEEAKNEKGFSIGPDLRLRLNVDAGSWLDPLRRRIDQFNQLSRTGRGEQIIVGMLRYGPYAAFVLLPLFALLLKLAYIGRARRYPARPRRYAAHLVFGAHNHAFLFLLGVLIVLVPISFVRSALTLWAIVYLLWSMKSAYGGRWSGVLARALAILFAYSVFFVFVVGGLAIAAVMLG
jgi:uncharacterized protein DUF3667